MYAHVALRCNNNMIVQSGRVATYNCSRDRSLR